MQLEHITAGNFYPLVPDYYPLLPENKRIVLNTNIRKAEVDPFGPPDENGRQEFEPLDDYF